MTEPAIERFRGPRTKALQRRTPISHEYLRNHAFFKERNPALFDALQESIRIDIFTKGEEILIEGAIGDSMYFLFRGEVEVVVGKEKARVATLQSGNIFGEVALFGSGRRTCTVRALDICDCRVVDKTSFQMALKRFPEDRDYFRELAKARILELNRSATKADATGENSQRLASISTPCTPTHLADTPPSRATESRTASPARLSPGGRLAARLRSADGSASPSEFELGGQTVRIFDDLYSASKRRQAPAMLPMAQDRGMCMPATGIRAHRLKVLESKLDCKHRSGHRPASLVAWADVSSSMASTRASTRSPTIGKLQSAAREFKSLTSGDADSQLDVQHQLR